jgi:hypothetical protein
VGRIAPGASRELFVAARFMSRSASVAKRIFGDIIPPSGGHGDNLRWRGRCAQAADCARLGSVRSQEGWAAGAASLTRCSQLAPRHFLHEHLFTSFYAPWLLENNWPDSKCPRFFWGWNCRGPAGLLCKMASRIWRAGWGWQFEEKMLPTTGRRNSVACGSL